MRVSWNKPILHDNFYETKKWAFIIVIAFTLIALHRLVPDFFCQYFRIWFRAAKKRKKCTQIRLRACLPISPFTNFSVFLFSSNYVNFEWLGQTCRTSECSKLDLHDKSCQAPCQITKCGCKINNLTIFSVFLFSSKYLNFEWFGQTCRTSECSKLDLRDECCPFRRRSKVAENGLVQGRKSKYP